MRFLGYLAVTLASGAACALAFPPHAAPLVAWFGFAPLLVVVRRSPSLPYALALAWSWMTCFAWGVGTWLPRSVSTYYDQPPLVGAAFFFGISTAMAAVYVMGFTAAYRRLARLPIAVVPFAGAAAWVATELARAEWFTGNPWALAGYSQVAWLPIVQIADVTGVFGVSFVVLLVNASVAELWLRRDDPSARRAALAACGLVLLVTTGVVGYGVIRLSDDPPDTPGTRVAVVQPNLDVGARWQSQYYGKHLTTYLRLTNDVVRESGAALVVWPEGAMTFFLEDEPLYQRAIARVIQPLGVSLLAGGPRSKGDPPSFWNSAFLLSPEGEILGHYDKQHLLPFAEYFPFAGIGDLQRRFTRVREFVPGQPTPLLQTPAGPAGVLICNETFYGGIAAARVHDGAELLVALANDSWVSDPQFSAIVFDMVRMRAIEQRRWIVRASTSGPSGLIDPHGRVVTSLGTSSEGVLSADVWSARGRTPYGRSHEAFAWGSLVFACALLVFPVSDRNGRTSSVATSEIS
jgi:apolipoprotein N-acyltransferase